MKGIHDGDRVRVRLGQTNLTQKNLAKQIGIASSTLSRMLNQASWRTDYLRLAGEALNTNFFEPYYPNGNQKEPILGILLRPDFLDDPDIIERTKDHLLKRK